MNRLKGLPVQSPSEMTQAMVGAMLEPGSVVGTYQVETQRGETPLGSLYAVVSTESGERAELLVLPSWVREHESAMDKLRASVEWQKGKAHTTFAPIRELVEHEELVGLVAELPTAPTLADRLGGGARFDYGRLLPIASGLLDGLVFAHSYRIYHGALAPAFVELRGDAETPTPRVRWFGVAPLLLDASPKPADHAAAPYTAPESVRGGGVDSRADLFSVGLLLWHAAVGAQPIDGTDASAVAAFYDGRSPVPSLAEAGVALPESLAGAIAEMTHLNRSRRPASASRARFAAIPRGYRVGDPVGDLVRSASGGHGSASNVTHHAPVAAQQPAPTMPHQPTPAMAAQPAPAITAPSTVIMRSGQHLSVEPTADVLPSPSRVSSDIDAIVAELGVQKISELRPDQDTPAQQAAVGSQPVLLADDDEYAPTIEMPLDSAADTVKNQPQGDAEPQGEADILARIAASSQERTALPLAESPVDQFAEPEPVQAVGESPSLIQTMSRDDVVYLSAEEYRYAPPELKARAVVAEPQAPILPGETAAPAISAPVVEREPDAVVEIPATSALPATSKKPGRGMLVAMLIFLVATVSVAVLLGGGDDSAAESGESGEIEVAANDQDPDPADEDPSGIDPAPSGVQPSPSGAQPDPVVQPDPTAPAAPGPNVRAQPNPTAPTTPSPIVVPNGQPPSTSPHANPPSFPPTQPTPNVRPPTYNPSPYAPGPSNPGTGVYGQPPVYPSQPGSPPPVTQLPSYRANPGL